MNIVFIIIGLGSLLVTTIVFGLGWAWPLIAGIMKRRAGKGGTGLIILGGIWLSFTLLSAVAVIGGGIWLSNYASQRWQTPKFIPAEYSGSTAQLLTSVPDCKATLSGETGDGSYEFEASNGIFTVPAGIFRPNSYSITKKDDTGRDWTASWWFYGKSEMELNLEPDSESPFQKAPPFTMRVTRTDISDGNQRINVQIVDDSGTSVSLRSSQKPGIEIIDAAGSVVWSRALSYG